MSLTYAARYRDGTLVEGLSFEESTRLFQEAHKTDNPCTVFIWPVPKYNPP